jgi:RNA polymerase sigma-70 factor (ECF subfamily)
MTEKEYNNCVTNYADNVYRFVLKNLKNTADAEDVVQSAFEILWQRRKEITMDNPKSFLFTIAYHKMIDLLRRKKKINYHDEMESFDTPNDNSSDNDLKTALNNALNKLDETKRALVLLKDYEGYSYEEIEKITSLSESQVKVYLHRARLQLRDYIVKIENII